MRPKSKFLISISIFLLSSCMVGPNYSTPQMELPRSFDEKPQEDEVSLNRWWEQFHDPELTELIEMGIAANLDLKIAVHRIAEVRYLYRLESANLLPEIDLNAEITRFKISENLSDSPFLGPVYQSLYQVGFDATWELDFFGKLRRSKEAALYEWQSSVDNLRDVYLIVVSEIGKLYVAIRGYQKRLSITEEEILAQKELVSLYESLYEAGLAPKQDVDRANADLQELKASYYPLHISLKQSLDRLAVLLGRFPEDKILSSREISIPKAVDKIPLDLPSELLRRRPDIRKAERQLAAETAKIGVRVAELFPSISLIGSYGVSSSHSNNWFQSKSTFWSIGPFVNWPLIDFGRIRSEINAQKALQKQALYAYEKTVLDSFRDVESALIAFYDEERRNYAFQKQTYEVQNEADLVKSLYDSGLESLIAFLEAKKRLLESELILTESEQALSTNLIAVYKSLGGDWSCDK